VTVRPRRLAAILLRGERTAAESRGVQALEAAAEAATLNADYWNQRENARYADADLPRDYLRAADLLTSRAARARKEVSR